MSTGIDLDYDDLRDASLEGVLRLAEFVKAVIPKNKGNQREFRHRLACNILRAMKRNNRQNSEKKP